MADEPQAAILPAHLRCELLVDPLGLDASPPSLSWQLEAATGSSPRSRTQSAFRLLVARSENELDLDRGTLWD